MAIEKQETNESQIGLSSFFKIEKDELRLLNPPTFNSLRSPPSTDTIIIIDDDEDEVTLEPIKKKPRLQSRCDDVDPFDELSNVVKGSPEAKKDNDVALRADSCYSSTDHSEKKNDDEKSLSTVTTCEHDEKKTKKKNDGDESVVESTPSNKGYGHVSLEDLGVSVEELKNIPWDAFDSTWELRSDPWYAGYI